jgi:hypothetical protein
MDAVTNLRLSIFWKEIGKPFFSNAEETLFTTIGVNSMGVF